MIIVSNNQNRYGRDSYSKFGVSTDCIGIKSIWYWGITGFQIIFYVSRNNFYHNSNYIDSNRYNNLGWSWIDSKIGLL